MRRVVQLVILVALVSACGLQGASPPPTRAKTGPFTLFWAKETDPAGINPLKAGDIHSWEIFSLVYEPLTAPNKDLTVGPGLAKSWRQTSDTSWRFQLREGVKFSNGRRLSAEDVVGTWDAYKKVNVLASLFTNVASMRVVDPLTFDVKLSAPTPDLPENLEAFWVLPGNELAAGSFDPDKDLLGTGPFVSGKHVQGVSWIFTPNPHYWRKGLPHEKRLEIKFIPDDASRLAAVRTGEVDFAMTANPDVQKILSGDSKVKVVVQQTTDMYYLWLNALWAKSKFRDKRIRQAFALAIDRKQIVDTALGGLGEITALTPIGLPDACDPTRVLGAEGRDIDGAKALLRKAGVSNLNFRITVSPSFGALRAPQIAQVIQQNVKEVGFNAEVSVLDGGAWIDQTFTKGTFDATVNWFTGGGTAAHLVSYMDPVAKPVFAKAEPSDPTTVGLVRKALTANVGPERTKAFAAACERINDEAYFIPLITKPTVIVYRADRIKPVFNPSEPIQMTFRRLSEFGQVR